MPAPSPDDLAACRALLRAGSRSFHAASLLLPRRVRDPATALYAFCRLGDDAVDDAADPRAGLALMRARLDAAYLGAPHDHPADRAFAATVAQYAIPRALPEALLEGFAWDAEGRSYDTLEALHDYAARVAGTVGAMMALVMGVRSPAALARATDLGTAMQLTNIARDVGEDARMGRVYLPGTWLAEAGLPRDALLDAPRHSAALATVVARLLEEAARLYARGAAGIRLLPRDCRPAIRAAHRIYAEIGAEVARNGFDSVNHRAKVHGRRKLALVLRCWLPALRHAGVPGLPALASNAFLVAAVPEGFEGHRSGFTGRVLWVAELFARLEQRERMGQRQHA